MVEIVGSVLGPSTEAPVQNPAGFEPAALAGRDSALVPVKPPFGFTFIHSFSPARPRLTKKKWMEMGEHPAWACDAAWEAQSRAGLRALAATAPLVLPAETRRGPRRPRANPTNLWRGSHRRSHRRDWRRHWWRHWRRH